MGDGQDHGPLGILGHTEAANSMNILGAHEHFAAEFDHFFSRSVYIIHSMEISFRAGLALQFGLKGIFHPEMVRLPYIVGVGIVL